MDKNDWIWVAIRVFGIYLLVLAVVAIPDVILASLNTYFFYHMLTPEFPGEGEATKALGNLARTAQHTALANLISSLARLLFFSLAGCYLTWKGDFLFRTLSRQSRQTPFPKGEDQTNRESRG